MNADNDRLNLLLQLRRPQEAEAFARECLGRNTDWAVGYCQLARALLVQKKIGEALAAARTGVSKDPTDAWAHSVLVFVLLEGDDPRAALRSLDEALRLWPQFAWAHYLRSRCFEACGNYHAMQNAAKEGLANDPHDEFLLYQFGWAQKNLGQHRAALRTAIDGLKLHPNSPYFWNLRGATHRTLGFAEGFPINLRHYRLASQAYRESIRLAPHETTFHDNYISTDHVFRANILGTGLGMLFVALGILGFVILPNESAPHPEIAFWWLSMFGLGFWIARAAWSTKRQCIYRAVTWPRIGFHRQQLTRAERRHARQAWWLFAGLIGVNVTTLLLAWQS